MMMIHKQTQNVDRKSATNQSSLFRKMICPTVKMKKGLIPSTGWPSVVTHMLSTFFKTHNILLLGGMLTL
jgi:hypothetical protein